MSTRGNSNSSEKKKPVLYIRTFGCQMNVRDSEVIAGLLKSDGCELTANPDDADAIIFNTCSVRQHAEDKVWSEVGRYAKRRTRDDGPKTNKRRTPIIGIVGCMAQNYKDEIFRRTPQVDFVVGPSDIHRIPGIIKSLLTIDHRLSTHGFFERRIWETDGSIRPDEIYHTGFHEDKEHAYVVISEGCSNYCSYCVVPYVRGELHNRNYEDILKEIKEAIDKGITKITLLGQNVNGYKFTVGFVELLKMVNDVTGLKEFSFVTSHPKDTTVELFKTMSECEKLKKYLHLPVQSGSDRILKLMNRGYAQKFYLDLVENYRKIVKGGLLTTDVILGFPTETEEDFQATLDLVKSVEFDAAYIFKYSTRSNTKAADAPDDVPQEEKERRHALILELQRGISLRKKQPDAGCCQRTNRKPA